jgi:hypothetical protein
MKKVLQALCLLIFLVTSGSYAQQTDSSLAVVLPNVSMLTPPSSGNFNPPLFYTKLWRDVMKCTGMYIPLSQTKKVKWSYVRTDAFFLDYDVARQLFIGYTFIMDDRIVVTMDRVEDHRLVKHEMAHYLMWQKGISGDHPDSIFTKCDLRVK